MCISYIFDRALHTVEAATEVDCGSLIPNIRDSSGTGDFHQVYA